jgi:hypothetical protein
MMNSYFHGMIAQLNQKHEHSINVLKNEIEGLKTELQIRGSSRREENT